MTGSLLLAELYKGDHPLMLQLRAQLEEIARTPGLVTVLIEGAPGTGKTTMAPAAKLIAASVHNDENIEFAESPPSRAFPVRGGVGTVNVWFFQSNGASTS